MNTSTLKLPPQGVLVAWKWEWEEREESTSSDESSFDEDIESREEYNPYLRSDSESSDDGSTEFSLPSQTHTVTFKCIGSTHDTGAQDCLSKASKILRNNGTVEMKMAPEPNNPYDARAVAFYCNINDNWQRIGYVVKECLEHLHQALSEKRILAVKLAWAKYLVCWSYSGPGFYAGVDVSIRGEWHINVIRSQSTR